MMKKIIALCGIIMCGSIQAEELVTPELEVGDQFKTCLDENPFKEQVCKTITIVDVRGKWVKYSYKWSNNLGFTQTNVGDTTSEFFLRQLQQKIN